PRASLRVLRQCTLTTREEVMGVTDAFEGNERCLRRPTVVRWRGTGQHGVDGRRDELHVPEFLGGDVRDEVVEGPGTLAVAEIEGLDGVVHEGGHLAEAPTHEFLNGLRAGRVGFG